MPRPRWWRCASGLVGLVALLALLLGGCVADAGAGLPTATPDPVFQPVATATGTPAPLEPLAPGELDDALRAVICWYEDPELARECLPPGEETLAALQRIALSGDERFIAPLVDMLWLEVGWDRWVREALEWISGQRFASAAEWYAWIAAHPPPLPDGYGEWKGRLLSIIDPRFTELIHEEGANAVSPHRLVWSHIGPADLPPLHEPETVHRVEERYLASSDRVFGVLVDGEARAYPERIVAWHGVVRDTVNGRPIVLWHCAACGGAVAFEARASNGAFYTFATSGLAYDSRRLLFDEQTWSLWDSVSGRAVHGPLAGVDVSLLVVNTVRTTWGEWSDRYPDTRVISLDTGYVRDYDEDAALRTDASADGPLFPVARLDDRHPPKRRVLGVTVEGEARAYDLAALESAGLLRDTLGGREIVILSAGPGRGATVYDAEGVSFVTLEGSAADRELVDDGDVRWFVDDERLLNSRNSHVRAALPSQVAYWFAWSGAYPDTGLWVE